MHDFGNQLITIFFAIFIYQTFGTIESAVWYFIVTYSAAPLSFIGLGFLWGRMRWNVKWLFLVYLTIIVGSFAFLYGEQNFTNALIFSAVYGFGRGSFWVGMHSFELSEVHNNERDFYSSMNKAGTIVLEILAPALATGSFMLSKQIFDGKAFVLLFILIPLSFLFSIPFLKNLANYRPKPILWQDIVHFFKDQKSKWARFYFANDAAERSFSHIAIPLAAVFLLGNETNVGIFETVLKIISALFIVWLAHMRHAGNRIKLLGIASASIALGAALLTGFFELWALVLFSLINIVAGPVYGVSGHTITLNTVESINHKKSDFFPPLILRSAVLWSTRIVVAGVMFLIAKSFLEAETVLRVFILFLVVLPLSLWFFAKKFFRGVTS